MITTNEEEILEKLVSAEHPFRKLNEVINFAEAVSYDFTKSKNLRCFLGEVRTFFDENLNSEF